MNKTILITGGTGTFGKAFIKHAISNSLYSKLIIYSRDEYKQHILQNQLVHTFGHNIVNKMVRFFLGDVRDECRLRSILPNINVVLFIYTASFVIDVSLQSAMS